MEEKIKQFKSIEEIEQNIEYGKSLILLTEEISATLLMVFEEVFDSSSDKFVGLVCELLEDEDDGSERFKQNHPYYVENMKIFKNKILVAIQNSFTIEETNKLATPGKKASFNMEDGDRLFELYSELQGKVLDRLRVYFKNQYKLERSNKIQYTKDVENPKYYQYALETTIKNFFGELTI